MNYSEEARRKAVRDLERIPGHVFYVNHPLWDELIHLQCRLNELEDALRGALPYMEEAERAGLVGHEGCHWPVEIVRYALRNCSSPTLTDPNLTPATSDVL